MLKLFDYVFYRVCKVYLSTKASSPEFTAAIIVSLMQGFNIVSVLMLIGLILHVKSVVNSAFAVTLFLAFVMANYIRYVYKEIHSYKVMTERYKNGKKELNNGSFVLLYIICSTVLFFGIAIYGGAQS